MLRILGCITHEHDLRLVVLSCIICALGCLATTACLARASDTTYPHDRRWLACAAAVFGCSVWSLHFVAMLAFTPGSGIAYDVAITAASVAIACGGALAALMVWSSLPVRPFRVLLGGMLLGLAIAGMHYAGIAAMRFSGFLIMDRGYVAASAVAGMLFSVIALARAADVGTVRRRLEVGGWLALAVAGVHFTGMAALTIAPGTTESSPGAVIGTSRLAMVVGGVSVAILLASLAAILFLQYLSLRKSEEARIGHLARHDALTGLPNRYFLQERLNLGLDTAARQGAAVAVLYIDLDRFKPVNDLYGHAIGDEVLVAAAKVILAQTHSADTLARIGGDEFVMVLTSEPEPDRARAIAGRIIEVLRRPIQVEGRRIEIGASVGIAIYPQDGADADALMRAADAALYRGKQEGRGIVRFFEAATNAQLQARLRLEHDLARAVEGGQLALHYQPIVNGVTGEIETFEALVRWKHPERGMVSPMEFIPLAEATGLIDGIGRWVIETACREAAAWPHPWRVSVNVSPVQFRQTEVCDVVERALAAAALKPARVVVEVTEGVLIDDAEKAVAVLNRLRDLGVRVALDDFGTGYSSLSYLQLFRFDKFKIDRSFVKRLGESEDALTITRTIVNLGHNLGLQVTAEGVETPQQLALVRMLGCDQVQGYLLARPAPMASCTDLDRARIKALFAREGVPEGVAHEQALAPGTEPLLAEGRLVDLFPRRAG